MSAVSADGGAAEQHHAARRSVLPVAIPYPDDLPITERAKTCSPHRVSRRG